MTNSGWGQAIDSQLSHYGRPELTVVVPLPLLLCRNWCWGIFFLGIFYLDEVSAQRTYSVSFIIIINNIKGHLQSYNLFIMLWSFNFSDRRNKPINHVAANNFITPPGMLSPTVLTSKCNCNTYLSAVAIENCGTQVFCSCRPHLFITKKGTVISHPIS